VWWAYQQAERLRLLAVIGITHSHRRLHLFFQQDSAQQLNTLLLLVEPEVVVVIWAEAVALVVPYQAQLL
jgi:hypothetical protein